MVDKEAPEGVANAGKRAIILCGGGKWKIGQTYPGIYLSDFSVTALFKSAQRPSGYGLDSTHTRQALAQASRARVMECGQNEDILNAVKGFNRLLVQLPTLS